MIRYALPRLAAPVAALALGGCSLAPQVMTLDATAPGHGRTIIDLHAGPATAVGLSRGVGARGEIGVRLETASPIDAWGKYTLLENRDGLSVAALGGASWGPSDYDARSLHAGPVLAFSRGPWTLSAGAQYNSVTYEADSTSFGTDYPGIRVVPEDDLSGYWQTALAIGYTSAGGTLWQLGVSCGLYDLAEPTEADRPDCLPLLSVSPGRAGARSAEPSPSGVDGRGASVPPSPGTP